MKEPYDWDEYAQCFFPKAEELAQRASEAEKAGEKEKASELYLFVICSASSENLDSPLLGGALPSGVSRDSRIPDQQSRSMLGKRAKRSSTRVPRESQIPYLPMKAH
jgi:hypothetical protein